MEYSPFYALYADTTRPSKGRGSLFFVATVGSYFLVACLRINLTQPAAHMHGVTVVEGSKRYFSAKMWFNRCIVRKC